MFFFYVWIELKAKSRNNCTICSVCIFIDKWFSDFNGSCEHLAFVKMQQLKA